MQSKKVFWDELFAKRPDRMKLGLERMHKGLSLLGIDRYRTTPSVIVAGTNGKGTTTGYLWKLLSLGGLKVGLYNSPHIHSITERFTVTGAQYSDDDIVESLIRLKRTLGEEFYNEISFFEVMTLLAHFIFKKEKTDLNIFEVGLGGRLDATNAHDSILSAVVSIGLDHTEWLGDSYLSVAHEKICVARPEKKMFIADRPLAQAEENWTKKILQTLRERNVPLVLVGEGFGPRDHRYYHLGDRTCSYPKSLCKTPEFLKSNFRLASAIFQELAEHPDFDLKSLDHVLSDFDMSFENPASLKGRFEFTEAHGRRYIFDLCHNPAAAYAFIDALKERFGDNQKIFMFISILKDKDFGEVVEILKSKASRYVLFETESLRSFGKEDMPDEHVYGSFEDAWKSHENELEGYVITVCGSFAAVQASQNYLKLGGKID